MMPGEITYGGLFEGTGALTMTARRVLGGRLAWYSEIEPAANRVLEYHHPDVPNIGDIAAVNWSAVPRVNVLTGGFPCTDVSSAGLRIGLRAGTRSGLWSRMAVAIDSLRPDLVVIENVRGLLSARADGDLESCPWCVGDDESVVLRALGCVLGDLADIGFDAEWCGLRASDVGAPHARYRIVVLAWPTGHPPGFLSERDRQVHGIGSGGSGTTGSAGALADIAADTERLRLGAGSAAGPGETPVGWSCGDLAGRDGKPATDTDGTGWQGSESAGGRLVSARGVATNAPCDRRHERRTESARVVGGPDVALGGGETASHSNGHALREQSERLPWSDGRTVAPGDSPIDWGSYGPAIRRWERILGRPAPSPTTPGKRGGQQLSPHFVEWLMGLPEGHVTAVPDMSRNDALKMLGNGVVPQQIEAAVRYLLPIYLAAIGASTQLISQGGNR